jgi:hypothetical protein
MSPRHDVQGNLIDPEEIEVHENEMLNEALDFYDAWDLLPYAEHIIWLSKVQKALGNLPFDISFSDIELLLVLHDEIAKKEMFDALKAEEKMGNMERKSGSIPKSAIRKA